MAPAEDALRELAPALTVEPASSNGLWGRVPALLAAAIFAALCTLVGPVAAGEAPGIAWEWVPSLGVRLAFVADGLALAFALLISGIGVLVLLYADAYLAGHPHWWRFAGYLFAFMLAMLGIVLADDLVTLFVFWELTTITSYLLIGFDNASEKSRRSALQALLVTSAGALAFLAGIILIYAATGTLSISELNAAGLQDHPLYLPILVLVLAGAFTKSAQVPFHFWLPNAMAAPTPVSAFLHSATMVKGGVFLLARLHPALSGTDAWLWTLTLAGGTTAVFASLVALKQTDLKQALAYTTLMALGTLTLLLGQSEPYAITAFATFLVVHSLYKAALFLAVGCMDHGTGTRDARILGGLLGPMPVTALAAGIAALSMAGLPPFLGFIAKELMYAGSIVAEPGVWLVTGALLAANALMFAVAGIVAFRPFWRPAAGPLPHAPHEAPWAMLAGPVILALLGAGFGAAPWIVEPRLVHPVVDAVTGGALDPKGLHLWAGVNVPLILSLATFALGLALYLAHVRLRAGLERATLVSFDEGWDRFLDGLKRLATWQTRALQGGVLRRYMATVFAALLAALGGTILARGLGPVDVSLVDGGERAAKHYAVLALIVAGAGVVVGTRSRIASVAALGAVGIGVALVFIMYGAPDVAITQLLVETLIVVLVAVVMLRLPFLALPGVPEWRPLDALLALATGAVVTAILLAVLATPLDPRLTEFFETAAWTEAFGRNVVNVILVDFRALDTFGEIAVVAVAAFGAYALLRTHTPRAEALDPGAVHGEGEGEGEGRGEAGDGAPHVSGSDHAARTRASGMGAPAHAGRGPRPSQGLRVPGASLGPREGER